MGNSRKPLIYIVVGLLALIVLRVGLIVTNPPDDRKLIQQALADAIKASREGRPGGVLELFSQSLKVNSTEVGDNQRQLANIIRQYKPDVTVTNPTPTITGDEARIVSPVELDLPLLGKREMKDVTLIFHREDTTAYLVIPTREWRLTEVRAPESAVADLISGQ